MEGKFVRWFTDDGLELQGLLCQPMGHALGKGILHLHGLAGNFYENRFIDWVGDAVTKRGYTFLTVNTRGHDYVADFLKRTDHELCSVQIGGAHETFEESEADIAAWLDFLEAQGCSDVALQGHSFGALKAVYYQSRRQDRRVTAMILASPPDMIGLQKAAHQNQFGAFLDLARARVDANQGRELMPTNALEGYPIDAETYLDFFGPQARTGIFDFHAPDDFQELASLAVPILAFFGTVNEAVVGDIPKCLQLIKANARKSTLCDTAVVEGAPHNYLGYERQVAHMIANWVGKLQRG
jgi:pimeloyl-ACP methyl ester carboxylesterase